MDPLGLGSGPSYQCEICGYYTATITFLSDVDLTTEIRPELSAATRQATEQMPGRPVLLTREDPEVFRVIRKSV
jgi:hypothetical protein